MPAFLPNTVRAVQDTLRQRLREPGPCPVQILTGPRQVGKTTLLLALVEEWGARAVYVAADVPEAAMPGWWENLWERAARLAAGGQAVVLLDELPYLPHWQRLLKAKVDELKRRRLPVRIVASGSSALSLARGSQETMAGRFERLRLLHWPAAELARVFGLSTEAAVRQVVDRGGHPGAVALVGDPPRWQSYVRDSIIEPAIGRDILAMETVRKPALLRQVFAVAVGHPAEVISLQKLCGQLGSGGAMETVSHYLQLLQEACLVAALPKYSGRIVRQRAAPPKLVVLNNGLLAAMAVRGAPRADAEPECWGRWVENACVAFAWNCGQTVFYWREEPHEVDLVTEGDWGAWAIEVKTGPYTARDLAGLLEFCRRYPRFRPLVLCDEENRSGAAAVGVTAMVWSQFLWQGLDLQAGGASS